MVVFCGDVHTQSRSADVGTVQARGWLVVERERAFVEFEANVRPLNFQ